ncbi:MAG: membrane fusion protein (multidrug efflux system) [Halieaceae bacterium]
MFEPDTRALAAPASVAPKPLAPASQDAATTLPFQQESGVQRKSRGGLLIAGVILLAALVPGGLWLQHQSTFIVSHNALVRAHMSELGTRVEGIVSEVLVDAGSRVKTGDVLLKLDDRHFRAELTKARAEHAALSARYSVETAAIELDRDRIRLRIAGAEAGVRRATAALQASTSRAEDAAAFHRTREALLPERAISREVVRDAAAKAIIAGALAAAASADQEAAINSLAEAHHNYRELTIRKQGLAVMAAQSDEAAALVARTEIDLEATVIRSPANGAIVRRLAQPGMAVGVGTPTLSMWFSDETWVEAWVNEADLAQISIGNPVQVTSPALPGEALGGVVSSVGLATDYEMPLDYLPKPRSERMQQAPLVGIAIRLHAMPALLRPGMSAVANIERREP